jgi:hypothetical protein
MLLVCVFSGLIIWYWITKCCALSGEDCFSHSQHSLVAYSSGWVLLDFSWWLWHVYWCHSCSTHVSEVMLVRLLTFLGDTISQQPPWLLFLQTFFFFLISLTVVSVSDIVSSAAEIFSSISVVLLASVKKTFYWFLVTLASPPWSHTSSLLLYPPSTLAASPQGEKISWKL